MKRFIALVLTLSFVTVNAFGLSSGEVVAKLKTYQTSSIKSAFDTPLTEEEQQAQSDVYKTLEDAVELAKQNGSSPELFAEILRVAVLMLDKDPYQYAGEVLLPLPEHNEVGYEAALKKLSKKDAKKIKDAVSEFISREKRRQRLTKPKQFQ